MTDEELFYESHAVYRTCRLKRRYARKPLSPGIDPKGYKLRAYHCPICNGFHLTKRPFDIYGEMRP